MTEPLVAFRLWEVASGPQLRSAAGGQLWEVGWTRAQCSRGHRAARLSCSCGFYGYFDLRSTHQVSNEVQVLGAALAAGLVQVHDLGLRAEYMRPIAFELPAIPPTFVSRRPLGLVFQEDLVAHRRQVAEANSYVLRLAEMYGCPIFDNDDDLLLYLREWSQEP